MLMPRKRLQEVNANGMAYLASVSMYEKQPQPLMPEPILHGGIISAAMRFYGIATSIYVFDYETGRGSLESLVNGVSLAVWIELGFHVVPHLVDFIRKRMQARAGIPEVLYTLPEEGF